MRNFFDQLAEFVVRRSSVVWLLILLISAGATIGHVQPELLTRLWEESDTEVFGPPSFENRSKKGSTEEVEANEDEETADVSPLSLSNSDAVLVVESEDFFTPRGAEALRDIVAAVEKLPQVSNVLWLDRVPMLNLFGLPEPLLPSSKASQKRFDAAKKKSLAHPLVGGQLLSEDSKTQLMLINYDLLYTFEDSDATSSISEAAISAASRYDDLNFRIRITGRYPTAIAALGAHEKNQLTFQLVGYGMIFAMALVLFRGLRAVIIVSLAPAVGVFWTTGYIAFFQYTRNPLVDVIVPILVSLVGLTDGVHLMVKIRSFRAQGLEEKTSAIKGLQQVGLACFLTSLTTAIGFGSLLLANSEWVREFAICCVLGVIFCFIAVICVIPLACCSRLGRNVHVGHDRSLIDKNLSKVGDFVLWVMRRRGVLSALAILSTVVMGGLAMTLEPDQRQVNSLPDSAEATEALRHVDKAFQGLEFAQVRVNWEESIPEESPEILSVVTKVDAALRAEDLLGKPLSIKNLIDAQPGSGPAEERMTLIELLPPPLKLAFFQPDNQQAVVTFRVEDLGIAKFGPVFERVEKQLDEISQQHPQFSLELTGDAIWRWKNLYQIVVDLAASLGTASVIILIVLTLVFRSVTLGLISIIPNLFPLAFTAACLVLAGFNLEVVMVCSFTICLGIAVDDTIHFLTRYSEERRETDDNCEAIHRAFTGVGTALIMTTCVLVAGFSVVTLSDSREHFIFAMMGALTIGAALFCDLVFLPALLAVFPPKRSIGAKNQDSQIES